MNTSQLQAFKHGHNAQSGLIDSLAHAGTEFTINRRGAMVATYDFSVLGGAIGTIGLKDPDGNPAYLPSGAIIELVTIDATLSPAMASAGSATVALQIQTTADLLAVTAVTAMTGLVSGIPADTAASMIKLSADSQPQIVIATAALSAGKMNVLIEYIVSN